MKRILFFLVLIPSLAFAQRINSSHKTLCFEENAGRVKSAEHNIRYILRSKLLDYYFWDGGYSIVQKNNEGIKNRIDTRFEENSIPYADEISGVINQIGSGKINCFSKIIYKGKFNYEFSFSGDSIIKKLSVPNPAGTRYSCIHFTHTASLSRTYRSAAGEFTEVLRNGNPQTASSTLEWMTYLGGNSSDELFGIALADDSGSVVVGRTASTDFPSTVGVSQDTFAGNYDAVITRFDKDGNCLWSSYFGGTNFDGAYQVITLDSVFVITGMTNSADLPVMNPSQPNNGGGYDAFLLMLNDSGQMVRSTYYGGSGSDQGLCIAKGNNGEIVLAGSTTSTSLPNTSTGYQTTMAGMIDAFISVWDDSFNVQWSSYYGGVGVEDIHAVCVTPGNEIAFGGGTRSNNFPVTANAWQSGLLSAPDNYMVKFDMSGNRLYATYFGGTNDEDLNGIVGDENGNIYMSGFTYSADFPTQGTIFQPNLLGQNDVYVSRFDSTGQLVWSTFIGGSGQDVAWGMTRLGKYIFVCGETESPAFPVSANAIQSSYNANSDGFVIKMDSTGQMVSGTFMGGSGFDALLAIAVDADTNVVACGDSYSTDLAVTSNAFQNVNHTQGDGYVVKFGMSEQLVSTNDLSIAGENQLRIFPNPASDFLTIDIKGKSISSVEILDATGRMIRKENYSGFSSAIPIHDLAPGMYFIRVLDDNQQMHVISFVKR
jgi:hypothetical protein